MTAPQPQKTVDLGPMSFGMLVILLQHLSEGEEKSVVVQAHPCPEGFAYAKAYCVRGLPTATKEHLEQFYRKTVQDAEKRNGGPLNPAVVYASSTLPEWVGLLTSALKASTPPSPSEVASYPVVKPAGNLMLKNLARPWVRCELQYSRDLRDADIAEKQQIPGFEIGQYTAEWESTLRWHDRRTNALADMFAHRVETPSGWMAKPRLSQWGKMLASSVTREFFAEPDFSSVMDAWAAGLSAWDRDGKSTRFSARLLPTAPVRDIEF